MTMTLGQNYLVSYSFCKVPPELELLELLETQLLSFQILYLEVFYFTESDSRTQK